MKLYRIIIYLAAVVLMLSSCKYLHRNFHWAKDEDSGAMIWTSDWDNSLTYKWDGETFENLIHGDGILYVFKDGEQKDALRIRAEYGCVNSRDKVVVDKDDYFVGNLVNDKFEGFGVYHKGGKLYVGEFKNGVPNGRMKYFENGVLRYEGEWKDGIYEGWGTLFNEDGTLFGEGEFEKGVFVSGIYPSQVSQKNKSEQHNERSIQDGYGEMTYNGNITYKGEYENGVFDGLGEYVVPNELTFCGMFSEGNINGEGTITFANGEMYSGGWINNEFCGDGKYVYANSDYYDGEWLFGLQHGQGVFHSTEYVYSGDWEEGWMNGVARVEFANKDIYEGDIAENVFHGQGIYYFANGNMYDGEFVNGKINGLGKFYFSNGSVYEGEFQDGKIKGAGTLYCKIGNEKVAITANWDGSNSLPKEVSMCFANGDLYEGKLVNGKPSDNGVWRNINTINNNDESLLVKANDCYKAHKETIDKVFKYVGYTLLAVGTVAVIVASCGAATPAVAAIASSVATTATTASTVVAVTEASVSIASAGVDYKQAIDNGDDPTEALNNLKTEAAFAGANIIMSKVPCSKAFRKSVKVLSSAAKSTTKPLKIFISKNKAFNKIVTVTKNKGEAFTQNVIQPTAKVIEERMTKPVLKKGESLYLSTVIRNSALHKQFSEMIKKGTITLSQKEFDALKNNSKDNLRAFIKAKVGKGKGNAVEFFIRMDKQQRKELLEDPYIKTYMDRAIRNSGEGGVHEWLMTKNFKSFLSDSKWGNDGEFFAFALTKLVQKTKNVKFKTGGSHHHEGSGAFHNGLAEVIENSNSKEDLFVNIKHYAKETLTEDSYKEFSEIFSSLFYKS